MRFLIFCISLVFIFSASAGAKPPPGYHQVFAEEFSGPLSVSNWGTPPAKWIAHLPYGGDFGDAWFTGPNEPKARSPFSVENGILAITAYRDPNRNNHWRSGLISSAGKHADGFSVALGYFECMMKLPPGPGVWPAFWLSGITGIDKQRTKDSVEIDVLEEYGVDSTIAHQHVHVWNPHGKESHSTGNSCTLPGMTTGFHLYGCLVTQDFIHFYFDDVEIWKTPTPVEALEPLYVLVDLALGGGWPIDQTPDPSVLLVDYIRVYAP